LIVHRTVSRVRAAALLHPSIVSRLANTILSAAMIARNAVGEAACIIRCPPSHIDRSSARAAIFSGHCQLAGTARATTPANAA
jgi:hypothetical protein